MCSSDERELPRLPLTEAPYADESLEGYLQRLAEINVYGNLHWIMDLAEIPASTQRMDYMFSYGHLHDLSKVTGCPPGEVFRMSYERGALYRRHFVQGFGGEFLSVATIEHKRPKVCPQCLLEKPYIRQIWENALLTACPVHGCELVHECPECEKPLRRGRPSMTLCGNSKCGFDLLLAEPKPVTAEEHAMACLVANALKTDNAGVHESLEFPEVLSVMPFLVLEDLIGLLGNIRRDGCALTSLKLFGAPMAERRDILRRTADVLKNWPHNWHRIIEQVRLDNGLDANGLQTAFNDLYLSLYEKERDGAVEFLREEFEVYLRESGFVDTLARRGGSRLLEVGSINVPYLTGAEARKEIGCTKKKLSWLLQTGELEKVATGDDSDGVHRITLESVVRYKQCQDDQVVGIGDMCEILGISVPTAQRLLSNGNIPGTRGLGRKGHEPWRIKREDIQQYLRRINAYVVSARDNNEGEVLTYIEAIRKYASRKIRFENLAEAMMKGELKPISDTGEPARIQDMRFRESVLDELFKHNKL